MNIGTQVGPYRIDALIGRGGMAEVYKAFHTDLHCYHALKVLLLQMSFDKSFVTRFLNEARTVAKLQHPHIAAIYMVSDALAEQPYFAMELVEGDDLADLIQMRRRFSLEEAQPILAQIASALDYAHGRGVVHRDVKPGNILLKPDGSGGWDTKVVDFGIARVQEESSGQRLTKTGMIVGTPEYMSPEQGGAGGEVDARTDQYSLAVIAYEMLCGEPPFRSHSSTTPISLIMQHVRDEPRPPLVHNPQLLKTANEAILRALAKSPVERFASCSEFVAALTKKSTHRVLPPPPVSPHPPRPKKSLLPAAVGLVAFAGAALLGLGLSQRMGQGDDEESTPADTSNAVVAPPGDGKDAAPAPPASMVEVPDVLNVREAQAREFAKAKSLKIDVTTGVSDSVPTGQVAGQYPKAGAGVVPGSTLRVRISTGPPAREPEKPSSAPEAPSHPRYSWPSSDAPAYTYPISSSELYGKSEWELDLMRNSIFARYGRSFNRRDLQSYFDSQSWYHRNPGYRDSLLSRTERNNAEMIANYQRPSGHGE